MDEPIYRVLYDDPQGNRRHVDVPRVRGIAYIRDGIWLDENFQYGLGDKCLHWLPPSRIVMVTKLNFPIDSSTRKKLKAVA